LIDFITKRFSEIPRKLDRKCLGPEIKTWSVRSKEETER